MEVGDRVRIRQGRGREVGGSLHGVDRALHYLGGVGLVADGGEAGLKGGAVAGLLDLLLHPAKGTGS